jgi:hypothetical protein
MTDQYPEGTWVEARFPITQEQQAGPRESWPWVRGYVCEVCGPDEWQVVVQAPELAQLEDGTPAPEGTPEEAAYYPAVFREASEIRPAPEADPEAGS